MAANEKYPRKTSAFNVVVGLSAAMLGLSMMFYGHFRYRFPRPWDREFVISGIVVDKATQQPVSKARLFVTILNEYGLLGWEYNYYGVEANQQGRFFLKRQNPIDIDYITIATVSPENTYASITFARSTKNEGLILELMPNPSGLGHRAASYDEFAGSTRIPPWKKHTIEIVSDAWTPYLGTR